jgi:hypothetical protein
MEVMLTVPFCTMSFELSVISTPTAPSNSTYEEVNPPFRYTRNHPAVPVLSALESAVIAAAVHFTLFPSFATLPELAFRSSWASKVPDSAVCGVAGWLPEYILVTPELSLVLIADRLAVIAFCDVLVAILPLPLVVSGLAGYFLV